MICDCIFPEKNRFPDKPIRLLLDFHVLLLITEPLICNLISLIEN